MGQKTTFLVVLPHLFNRLEFSDYILTKGRSWTDLVHLGCLVDFRPGASIFGAKNYFLVHLPYILNRLEFSAHILTQGRSWVELAPLGCHIHFGQGGSIFGATNTFFVHLQYLLKVAISWLPLGMAANVFETKISYNSSNLHVLQNYKPTHVKHTHSS